MHFSFSTFFSDFVIFQVVKCMFLILHDFQIIRNPRQRGVVLREGQSFQELYEERVKLFEKYADITIDEDQLSVEETISKVLSVIKI